jgi:hypothetical protein
MRDDGAVALEASLAGLESALKESSWTNVQAPVVRALECMGEVVRQQARELASAREEAALAVREISSLKSEMRTVEARQPQMSALESRIDRLGESMASSAGTGKVWAKDLEDKWAGKQKEVMAAVSRLEDQIRRAAPSADLAGLLPRSEGVTRAELAELDARLQRKAESSNMDSHLAKRVAWPDLENILRGKADVADVAALQRKKLDTTFAPKVEAQLAALVGRDELRRAVDDALGEIPAMAPRLRLLIAGADKEDRESAEGGSGSLLRRGDAEKLFEKWTKEREARLAAVEDVLSRPVTGAQLRSALSTLREGIGRSMDGELGRWRAAAAEEQVLRLREVKAEVAAALKVMQHRIDSARGEAEASLSDLRGSISRKATLADLEGKANAVDVVAISNSLSDKVGEGEFRESLARTMAAVSSLTSESAGVRIDVRGEMDRLSQRLVRKADADQLADLHNEIKAVQQQQRDASAENEVAAKEVQRQMATMVRLAVQKELKKELPPPPPAAITDALSAAADPAALTGLRDKTTSLERQQAELSESLSQVSRNAAAASSGLDRRVDSLTGWLTKFSTSARWLWRSGTTLREGWVPWEIEAANSAPSCFTWERGASRIVVLVPGLYHLSVSLFAPRGFQSAIYVNDEPLVSLGRSDGEGVESEGSAGRTKVTWHSNASGVVAGCSVAEHVLLPKKAAIAVR